MPRPGPRRDYVALRLDVDSLTWINKEAVQRGLNRSEMMRLMMAYAQQHMPDDLQQVRTNQTVTTQTSPPCQSVCDVNGCDCMY